MSSSSPSGTARVALVGATSLLGREIKEQLAASGFPSQAVEFFDLEEVAGVLTEYGDEARILAETVMSKVLENDLVCFCGSPESTAEHLPALLESGRIGIDCTGAWMDADEAFVWIPGCSTPPRPNRERLVAIPGGAALLLAETLAALPDHAASAVITLFVPASESGEPALKELSQQSTAVLNLEEVPDVVFGRQLAFDVWPPAQDSVIGGDRLTAVLAGLGLPVPSLQVVAAPTFHGLGASMFLPNSTREDVTAALQEAEIALDTDAATPIDSPVRIAGVAGLRAVNVRADTGGTWVWLVLDNLHARAAAAVTAIHTLTGSALSDASQ